MPITEITIMGIWCDADGCSAGFDMPPENSESALLSSAEEEGWSIDGDKCYCKHHADDKGEDIEE